MKRKITKAEFEALTPEMKLVYVADGEGFKLSLADDEDPDALRRALIREKADLKEAKDTLASLKAEVDALKTDPARKNGDIKVIEDSWREKVTEVETRLNAVIATKDAFINKTLIEAAAVKVAAAVTSKPENASLILPHITSRFEVVMDGDTPVVKIKDASGRLSAISFEELQKEITATPKFETVVVGTRASGAGGTGGSSSNGGSGGAGGGKKFADMTGPERTELYRTDRARFDSESAAEKAARDAKKFGPHAIRTA